MNQAEIYFSTILNVAGADGYFAVEEIDYIENSLLKMGLEENSKQKLLNKLNDAKSGGFTPFINEVIPFIKETNSPSFIMNLIRDSYELASSDGEVSDSELSLINEIISQVYNDDSFDFSSVIEWVTDSLYIRDKGVALFSKVTK